MEYLRQTIDSDKLDGVFALPKSLINRRVDVIILPEEDDSGSGISRPKRRLGFVKAPPLPDSFFDPLPEEDLQAWGL